MTVVVAEPGLLRACLGPARALAPVEYGAAVDLYLAQAALGAASRRVYRISLTAWAWPLVGKRLPVGAARRQSYPPFVPLALLDDSAAAVRLAAAVAERAATAGPRTVNRELSALRSAVGWWREQDWVRGDPTAGLRHVPGVRAAASPPLAGPEVEALFRAAPSLREHAFWRVLHDSGAPAPDVLALDIGMLDLPGCRARPRRHPGPPPAPMRWSAAASQLLRWLTAGRADGPVFLTGRRAPAGSRPADVCPFTGRARLSYRRAAEIFTAATRPLDPMGKGWTLHQLRRGEGDGASAHSPA